MDYFWRLIRVKGGKSWLISFLCSTDVLFQVSIYLCKTWSFKEGAILGCLALILHMLSILYLRLEYHKVYEGILVLTTSKSL